MTDITAAEIWLEAVPRNSARPRRFHRLFAVLTMVALVLAAIFVLAGPVTAFAIGPIDKVLVDKSARSLSLLRDGEVIFSTAVSLGKKPAGQKRAEGDQRTPEGKYRLIWSNPDSTHYRSILVSYPSKKQAAAAAANGQDPGGGIMIHGQRQWWRFLTRSALTDGCIGVSNYAMDVVWNAVELGTPIEIRP